MIKLNKLQKDILESDSKVTIIADAYGSGKTVGIWNAAINNSEVPSCMTDSIKVK
jgi:hypothetical protein